MSVDANGLVEKLTRREYEVLELMVKAHSNREISDLLNVSIETVRTHTKRIYAKLNVSGRQEASFKAIRLGLIEDPLDTDVSKQSNLHTTYDFFVGREADLSALAQLFARGERFVSIVGVGGMGKTRLAIEFARQSQTNYQHGIYMIELESVDDAPGVVLQIADSLSIHLSGQPSSDEQVLNFLQNKELLLIIDNCEHILDRLDFLTNMLQTSDKIHILATSRERLNLRREVVYALGGLSIPADDTLNQDHPPEVVQLLERFAKRAQPDWKITDDNRDVVYSLCRITQGMPLAIILAAGWLDVYPLARIVEEIQRNVDFLETDLRDVPDRHRSVRAVFDWTWRLLTDDERDVLMKFSVFRNGCTVDAVEAVTDANPHILKSLISKALIQRDTTGRYRIHPLLRQYSAEKLEASSNIAQQIYHAHATYFVSVAEDMMTNKRFGEHMKAELDNLYSAWHWLVDTQNIDLLWQCVNTYGFIAYQLGNLRETKALYLYALDKFDETAYPHLIGCLSYVCASLHTYVRDYDGAKDFLAQADNLLKDLPTDDLRTIYISYHGALATRCVSYEAALEKVHIIAGQLDKYNLTDDRVGQTMLGYVHSQIAYMYTNMWDDYVQAEISVQQALRSSKAIQHHFLIAYTHQQVGIIRMHQEIYEDAQRCFRISEQAYDKIVKTFDYAGMQYHAARVALALGQKEDARIYFRRALELYYEYGFTQGIINLILDGIPLIVNFQDIELAIELLGYCMENTGYPRQQSIINNLDSDLRLLVDKAVYTQALQLGRLYTYDTAVRHLMVWLED